MLLVPYGVQHFESDTINGDGAMINGVYYFVIPEAEKIRVSNVIRKSLDLEEITELKHIETKETQSSVNIEQNAPQNNSNVQEQGDTYVEPNVTPNYNDSYNYNNNSNDDDDYVAPTNPSNNGGGSSAVTPTAPATQMPQATAAPEQPQPVQPTQSAPATQEPVAPTQPTQKQNP